mmetsp:Transcript_3812/g.9131  ORF Transcript_3812/g.9131 Transcript_3812/m.9131 type:complete len:146 (+) Transcript_3812:107-544(+)
MHLDRNRIGDDGGEALVNALQVNSTLTTISIWGNPMSNATKAKVDALVERNSKRPAEAAAEVEAERQRRAVPYVALRTARRTLLLWPSAPMLVVDTIIVQADARCGDELSAAQRHALIVMARQRPVQPRTRVEVLQVVRQASTTQ